MFVALYVLHTGRSFFLTLVCRGDFAVQVRVFSCYASFTGTLAELLDLGGALGYLPHPLTSGCCLQWAGLRGLLLLLGPDSDLLDVLLR